MKFKRLSSQAAGKTNQGPEPASCLARFWHHFSTSVLDVFLYRGVQGTCAELHSHLVTSFVLRKRASFIPLSVCRQFPSRKEW